MSVRLLSANPLIIGRLELLIEARASTLARAQLFDVAGRVVATAEQRLAPGVAARVSFDTQSLAPGLYLVRVGDGAVYATNRVVIAR